MLRIPHIRFWLALAGLAGLFTLVPGRAAADPIIITFDNATLPGTPGQTLTFSGVISNPGTNSISLNLTGDSLTPSSGDIAGDDTDFQNYLFTLPPALAPGGNTGDIDLFTVTISPTASAPEVISGNVFEADVDGGPAYTGSADFTVDVTAPVSSVPEPPALALLAGGLLLLLGLSARRHPAAGGLP